jgi:adenine-specific DNA-methyltransferase
MSSKAAMHTQDPQHAAWLRDTDERKAPERPSVLLEQVDLLRLEAARKLDAHRKAELGQFLTPAPVARLMASMLQGAGSDLHILDAGAGVGALFAACIAELCSRPQRPRRIAVTAYEIDETLAGYLQDTLRLCEQACHQAGIAFQGDIHQEDFLASAVSLLRDDLFFTQSPPAYTCAVLNPPYRKIHSSSKHRKLLRSIGMETGNLYTGFLALAAHLLAPGGEMVAITPRSFCNGPYFKPFRTSFLHTMSLRRIHIFASRDAAFRDDEVLQENIIFHAVRSHRRPAQVTISSSAGPDDALPSIRGVDYDQVVPPGDPDAFIHIPSDALACEVAERMGTFSATLDSLGITVSTGRVVDFRAKQFLRFEPEEGTVPLIYPGNFSQGFVKWPLPNGKKAKALRDTYETRDLLVPAGFYVLTKRFSAKEERRRIVAAVYDRDRIKADRVGFENHLNYYHINGRGLPRNLAIGLAAFLNSTLVDAYFRLFNGHTQVNATDLRKLRYPSRSELEALGAKMGDTRLKQEELDRLIERELLEAVHDAAAGIHRTL